MNIDQNFFIDNTRSLLILVVIIVIIIILIYASNQTSMQKNNCNKLIKNFPQTYKIIPMATLDDTVKLTNLFIKTAYNCCCSGKFKNDYVDICALENCAKYGVRALDFQVYKLNGKAIISASMVNEIKYKEIYNYLDFNDTMLKVYKNFIANPTKNINNNTEPLFLIFRVYSKAKDTYDQMYDSLNNIFGAGLSQSLNNILFFTSDLTNATFNQLKGKVIILVECCGHNTFNLECNRVFNTSSLSKITSLVLTNDSSSKIYRESQLVFDSTLSYVKFNNDNMNNLNIIYPNLQTNSHNYDFITSGFNNGISFIGLNFQTNDGQLARLNKEDDTTQSPTVINGFGGYAFKLKPDISTSSSTEVSELLADFRDNVKAGNTILSDIIETSMNK